MEVMQNLHMNKGEGETSYSKNSNVQRQIISLGNSIVENTVKKCFPNTFPQSMGIADLGCSTGSNSLMVMSHIINTIYGVTVSNKVSFPELRIMFNDLSGNDFNVLFISLPEFYKKLEKENGIGLDDCFTSAVVGSFYGRLFPEKSLHFVHSSSSLHWLSRVPPALDMKAGKHLNKGKIYISKTSPACVIKAYLSQFQEDLYAFFRSRAKEIVGGGGMVLSFMGRNSPDAVMSSPQLDLVGQALMSMSSEGLVDEDKIDSFNTPYYAPSVEEVTNVIEEENSFIINGIELFEISWDAGCETPYNSDFKSLSRGQKVAKTLRAVLESMMESHFGKGIIDELFTRFGKLTDDYFCQTRACHINLMISLTRKDYKNKIVN